MRIHYFQHVPFEGPANIASWASERDFPIKGMHLYRGESLPSLEDFDFLLIMGGPMGVGDERQYPWLKKEKEYIRFAIEKGKIVLGVCLGAQMIAELLGARVFPNDEKEIGWFPITLIDEAKNDTIFKKLPDEFMAFHWHGDTFSLPEDAIHLAKSQACQCQAFLYQERVLGLQFNLESNKESIKALIENDRNSVVPAPFIQSPDKMLSYDLEIAKQYLYLILDGLIERTLY